ncbi:MAG: sensor domain-containing diguanylate cyclase [Acidobacteria bacterium]|nr:sensor domain-containing diguanylate cyclase [Acidobacteriota bacterium]
MYSLFHFLASQHSEEFAPVRCNEQTLRRLVRYFEDVVTENKLPALVVKGQCPRGNPQLEQKRLAKLCSTASQVYLFSCLSDCPTREWLPMHFPKLTAIEESAYHAMESGSFILVLNDRFCGLLVSTALTEETAQPIKTYEMMWSFDANVVFTAIEYLMAKIIALNPQERGQFESLLNTSTPNRISWKLGFSLTTKLAMLMQRQNELEMATNRISYTISNTLEIENVLQSAVEEVGQALKAKSTELLLWKGKSKPTEENSTNGNAAGPVVEAPKEVQKTYSFYQSGKRYRTGPLVAPVESLESYLKPGTLEIPVKYHNASIGALVVDDDTPGRLWEDEEILMIKTVSDQLAVAISHARLFRQMQTQAITDSLTGLFNYRFFQVSLDREIKMAERHHDVVSLILLDLDRLKKINDTYGHRAGDAALVHIAQIMKQTIRTADICARYGGEEFVLVLPRCTLDEALLLAERLRNNIASTPLPKIGQITASIGVATYPFCANSKEDLIEKADQAMYLAKESGRNRVMTFVPKPELQLA